VPANPGVHLPLILDDVLIALDEERTERCLDILAEFSVHHQMILLTCHESTMQRAKAAGAEVRSLGSSSRNTPGQADDAVQAPS